MSNESKKVKSRTVLHTEYKVQISKTVEPLAGKQKERIEYYDHEGNIIEEIQFDREGNEFEKIRRTFGNGKILSLEKFYGEEDPDEIKLYEYDDQGNISSEKLRLSDGSVIETRNSFSGNLAVRSLIIDEDDGNSEIIREFDTKGNILKVTHLSENGQTIEQHEFTRDSNGNITGEKYKNNESGEEYTMQREFDAAGRVMLEIRNSGDGSTEKSHFEYGPHGMVLFVRNIDGSIETGTYEYDEKGRVISRTLKEKAGDSEEEIITLQMEEIYEDDLLKSTHVNQFNPAMQIVVPYDYFYEYEFF